MQINGTGNPVLEEKGDVQRLDKFLDKLADAVYSRLPRVVRLFLSRDALRQLLGLGADELTARVGV
jgi:hypothetical protein